MRKRNMKRMAAALLAATVGISGLSTGGITVSAAEESGNQVMELAVGAEASDFSYEELEDGTIAIMKYNGSGGDVSIPEQIDGKSVTLIGYSAFSGCSGLTSIEIPGSVTSIGYGAFSGCSGLTSIEIPGSVTIIGVDAFSGCSSLESITVDDDNPTYDSRGNCNAIIEKESNELVSGCKNTIIPSSVTVIGHGAFRGCSGLTGIEIPGSVTSIEWYVFFGCSGLTSIEIPGSVTSIGYGAFSGCSEGLVIRGTEGSYAQTYASKNGISFQAIGSAAKKNNEVTVSKTSYSLTASTKQQTISLDAKATGGTITYASDNKNVTVTSQGKVTIVKNFVGTAKITVTAQSAEYEKATAVITVNVAKASQSFKNAVTKKTVKQARKAQSFQIGAKAAGKVTYTVTKKDAKKVLTVSKTGKVTIKKNAKAGTYTVKVKATAAAKEIYKKTTKTYTIKVTVKKK